MPCERCSCSTITGLFTSFATAVAGLTAAQAATVPAPRFNSIWAVVNHVRFWQELTLLQVRGQPVDRQALGAENGWPPVGESTDEAGWQAAVQRCLEVNRELAEATAALSDEALAAPLAPGRAAPWQLIQGMIAHNAYHTNEVISIRHTALPWVCGWQEREEAVAIGHELGFTAEDDTVEYLLQPVADA